MDIDELGREYDTRLPEFKKLESEVLFIFNERLQKEAIKINIIESRVKSIRSLKEKIANNMLDDPFNQVKDLVGFRIVCLFISDIPIIRDIIFNDFDVIEEDNKIEANTSSFGYMSLHFICKLKLAYEGPRYNDIKEMVFEIQLRTITMHAWANISHYLDYKTNNDIPEELRRDFYALSGLFYVVDKHFELFYESSRKMRKEIAKTFKQNKIPFDQDINLDSLIAYLKYKLPDRKHADSKSVSELVHELRSSGYKSIADIENAFELAWEAFQAYELEKPPHSRKGRKYYDIGVVRTLFELIDDKFCEVRGFLPMGKKYKQLLKTK